MKSRTQHSPQQRSFSPLPAGPSTAITGWSAGDLKWNDVPSLPPARRSR